jgi:hypothetical protein
MAGRSGDTFKKRQKEVARAEKHREKLARRLERKQNKGSGEGGEPDDNGLAANDLSEDQMQDEAAEETGTSQIGGAHVALNSEK